MWLSQGESTLGPFRSLVYDFIILWHLWHLQFLLKLINLWLILNVLFKNSKTRVTPGTFPIGHSPKTISPVPLSKARYRPDAFYKHYTRRKPGHKSGGEIHLWDAFHLMTRMQPAKSVQWKPESTCPWILNVKKCLKLQWQRIKQC